MNATSSSPVRNRTLFETILHKHVEVYRTCCDAIAAPLLIPLNVLYNGRKYSYVDLGAAFVCRAANSIAVRILGKPVFDEAATKTSGQKNCEKEIVQLRSELSKLDSECFYPEFSQATSQYFDVILPMALAKKIYIPPAVENLLLYELCYIFNSNNSLVFYQTYFLLLYAKYQLDKQTGYRASFCNSRLGKDLAIRFARIQTNIAHALVSKNNVESFFNVEHILLNYFLYIKKNALVEKDAIRNLSVLKEQDTSQKLIGVAIKSLAKSLSYQKEIDQFLAQLSTSSEEDRMIARLAWHKKNNRFSPGLPDPDEMPLSRSNIDKHLDESLSKFLEPVIEQFLNRMAPEFFSKGFFGWLYWLEGKEPIIKYLSTLLIYPST